MKPTRLFAAQFSFYPRAHADRRNLVIHALTEPLFVAGVGMVASAAWVGGWRAVVAGFVAMIVAMAAQGRGHRLEQQPPLPFRGPLDVVARIFAEQLVTFPRFVLSGGFARAWRGAGAPDGRRVHPAA
jgi:hypothetical protein